MESKFDIPDWIADLVDKNKLPTLELGNTVGHTDYIDFITVNDVTSPIMYGVDIYQRPFLTLRVLNRKDSSMSVHTIFQRYTDSQYPWCCGTMYKRIVDTCIRDIDKEFLTRLFKHQPCGESLFYGGEKEKVTSDGKPILELA